MGWATQHSPRPTSRPLSQASCVIVSGFRAALDLGIYPHRNLIRPRCTEQAKPGRGKPVLILHIGFFACFHAIHVYLVACSARIVVDKQTDRQTDTHRTTTVTLAAHARQGLIKEK